MQSKAALFSSRKDRSSILMLCVSSGVSGLASRVMSPHAICKCSVWRILNRMDVSICAAIVLALPSNLQKEH